MGKGLRVNEVYGPTVQGEGPTSGMPTQFLRLSGCNLRCPGWEVEAEIPQRDGSVKLVKGCDTPRAVHPQLYRGTPFKQPEEIVAMLSPWPKRVCLTGGEPLFGPAEDIEALIHLLVAKGYAVDLFTNGTMPLTKVDSLASSTWRLAVGISVCMDYKLSSSGEGGKFDWDNVRHLWSKDAVKFVVKDEQDYMEAVEATRRIREENAHVQLYVGGVFGVMDNDVLLNWMLSDEIDWTFQLQMHKYGSHLDQTELEMRLDLPQPNPKSLSLVSAEGRKLQTEMKGKEPSGEA